jgi:hypothetical protein
VAAVTYLSEERATELLTGQAGASGIDQADLAWLLATNIEAFLTNGDEPLSFERITACLGVLDALHQEVLLRVLRPFQDGSRGAGVDPLAESNAAALEALQDFMREKILRDLGIDPPGTASPAEAPEPLRFPPAGDGPDEGPQPPFPNADWVNEDDPLPGTDSPPRPPPPDTHDQP